jgi:hypothetical protein
VDEGRISAVTLSVVYKNHADRATPAKTPKPAFASFRAPKSNSYGKGVNEGEFLFELYGFIYLAP